MLQIFDERVTSLQPTMPKYKALCVFDFQSAKLAFQYNAIDFVFTMDEKTCKFAKCDSLKDVEDFFNAL
jgi:hypothetical protein